MNTHVTDPRSLYIFNYFTAGVAFRRQNLSMCNVNNCCSVCSLCPNVILYLTCSLSCVVWQWNHSSIMTYIYTVGTTRSHNDVSMLAHLLRCLPNIKTVSFAEMADMPGEHPEDHWPWFSDTWLVWLSPKRVVTCHLVMRDIPNCNTNKRGLTQQTQNICVCWLISHYMSGLLRNDPLVIIDRLDFY